VTLGPFIQNGRYVAGSATQRTMMTYEHNQFCVIKQP